MIQLFMVELILGVAILGGIAAYGKTLTDRICRFATIPIAFLAAFLLTKLGVWDSIGKILCDLIMENTDLSATLQDSAALQTGVQAILFSILRVFLIVPTFWVILWIVRLVLRIVLACLGAKKRWKIFQRETAKAYPFWKKLITCAIGVVGGYLILMLSLLPMNYLTGLLDPALEKAATQSYNGTYVQAVAEPVEQLLPTAKSSVCGKIQTFTGVGGILRGTIRSISSMTLTNNAGKEVEFNTYDTLQGLIGDVADGLVLYQSTCKASEHTLRDLAPAALILNHLSQYDVLMEIGSEALGNLELTESGGTEDVGLTTQLITVIQKEYADGDLGGAALKNDLAALSELLQTVTERLGDTPLNSSNLTPELIDFLQSPENAYTVTSCLSKMNIYEGSVSLLTEFGMTALCDILELSEDRAAYYEKYMADVQTVLNDRTEGTYDPASVELFLRYAVDEALVLKNEPSFENEDIALAYAHYQRFMAQQLKLEQLFCDYHLDSASALTFYTAADSTRFVYHAASAQWKAATAEDTLRLGSPVAQQLLEKTNARFTENAEASITDADIIQYGNTIGAALSGDSATLAKTLASNATFQPDVVYGEDLVLNTGFVYGEAENRQFANVLSTAATVFGQISANESTDSSMEMVMDNFPLVGRLLDDLQRFKMTEALPETLLLAITQSSEYGQFFVSDSIKELIQNVKNGQATYEELFTTVQALYGIINQIVPK